MGSVVWLINTVIQLYIYALIIGAVLSWLVAFGVINLHNQFVYSVNDFLRRITDPALDKIRRYVRPLNGVDLSPIILILALMFIQRLIIELFYIP